MGNELKQVLRRYVSQFRSEATKDDYLFCNVGNQKLTSNALKCSIRSYNKSRGVNLTGVHAFRHTFAKNWIRNNGDVFSLQKILGHKSLEMTRRYVNMFSDDLKKDYDKYCPLERIKSIGNARNLIGR
ncbi:Tyrosine recombinase XerC [bioreactor metagenome]|uniref:Tyrosine recombinase XerC n=1 Tax=bioreactor metagenome TaxID=1076179 RepID=A0A645CHH9_9ZZZZ